ncbi:MAG: methionyl-tRNA formyltransferase [Ignavibacteria bacterium]|jgi:methionyl-tRNA formyltransferase
MNIIFMGTPEFAVPSLNIILSSHHQVSAVVTAPDKPQGRGLKPAESAVKRTALSHDLNILQPDDLHDKSFSDKIQELSPDLIVIVAFRILPREVFTIPKFGSINLHASLLPKYRGAAPINWALINGEKETGVTTFFLKERVDTGNIIMAEKCSISDDDDAGTLHDKLALLGANTLMSTLNLLEMTNGNVPVYEQSEALYTRAPKIFKEFCKINWDNSARTLYNFIRGLSPYPTAFTHHNGKILKIFRTLCSSKDMGSTLIHLAPGTVEIRDGKMHVICNDGFIEILEIQLEGKKRMSVSEFIRGYKIQHGDMLTHDLSGS